MRRLSTLLLFVALAAAPALGQGCIMCYTSAKAAATGGQRAMNHAVAVLLFPPVAIMSVLVGFAFYHNRERAAAERHQEQQELWKTAPRG